MFSILSGSSTTNRISMNSSSSNFNSTTKKKKNNSPNRGQKPKNKMTKNTKKCGAALATIKTDKEGIELVLGQDSSLLNRHDKKDADTIDNTNADTNNDNDDDEQTVSSAAASESASTVTASTATLVGSATCTKKSFEVFIGRGNGFKNKPGNRIYRNTINNNRDVYQHKQGNKAKHKVAKDLVATMKSMGAVFYYKDPRKSGSNLQSNGMVIVPYKILLDKVKQSLRERPKGRASSSNSAFTSPTPPPGDVHDRDVDDRSSSSVTTTSPIPPSFPTVSSATSVSNNSSVKVSAAVSVSESNTIPIPPTPPLPPIIHDITTPVLVNPTRQKKEKTTSTNSGLIRMKDQTVKAIVWNLENFLPPWDRRTSDNGSRNGSESGNESYHNDENLHQHQHQHQHQRSHHDYDHRGQYNESFLSQQNYAHQHHRHQLSLPANYKFNESLSSSLNSAAATSTGLAPAMRPYTSQSLPPSHENHHSQFDVNNSSLQPQDLYDQITAFAALQQGDKIQQTNSLEVEELYGITQQQQQQPHHQHYHSWQMGELSHNNNERFDAHRSLPINELQSTVNRRFNNCNDSNNNNNGDYIDPLFSMPLAKQCSASSILTFDIDDAIFATDKYDHRQLSDRSKSGSTRGNSSGSNNGNGTSGRSSKRLSLISNTCESKINKNDDTSKDDHSPGTLQRGHHIDNNIANDSIPECGSDDDSDDDSIAAAAPLHLREMLKDTSLKSFFMGSDDSIIEKERGQGQRIRGGSGTCDESTSEKKDDGDTVQDNGDGENKSEGNGDSSKQAQQQEQHESQEGLQHDMEKLVAVMGSEDDDNVINNSVFRNAMDSSMRSLFKQSRSCVTTPQQYKSTLKTHEEGEGEEMDQNNSSTNHNDYHDEDDHDNDDDDLKPAAPVRLGDTNQDASMKSFRSFFGGSDESIGLFDTSMKSVTSFAGSKKSNLQQIMKDGEDDDDDNDDNLQAAAPVPLRYMKQRSANNGLRSKSNEDMRDSFRSLSLGDSNDEEGNRNLETSI